MEEAALADLMRERFPRERLQALRSAGMRYRGQSYEVSVPVPELRGPDNLATLARRFHDAHHRRYGHMAQAEAVEIVNFEVTGVGMIPKPSLQTFPTGPGRLPPHAVRKVWFAATDAVDVPVFRRAELAPGDTIAGPAVIEEQTSTLVLYPGQTARVDGYLNIEIEVPSATG